MNGLVYRPRTHLANGKPNRKPTRAYSVPPPLKVNGKLFAAEGNEWSEPLEPQVSTKQLPATSE